MSSGGREGQTELGVSQHRLWFALTVTQGEMRGLAQEGDVAKIALITILADDVPGLVRFYCNTLGFRMKSSDAERVELEHEGVRLAICSRAVLAATTHHPSYGQPRAGQSFALAFPLHTHEELDEAYASITASGATPVQTPVTTPWGQRTAFFADPEGNIHQLFADLPAVAEYCF